MTRRSARTDTARAAFLVWGGSLLVTLAVFSFMAGIFHEYYTVALAPYVAAVIGMGVTVLWEERAGIVASATLALAAAGTAVWAYVLLGRTPDYVPWLRWAVLVGGLLAAVALLVTSRLGRPLALAAAGLAVAASLAGPLAYTLTTVNTAYRGSIITAGPAVARGGGGFGGGGGPRFAGGAGGAGGAAEAGMVLPGQQAAGQAQGQGQGQAQGQGQRQGQAQGQGQGLGQGQTPAAGGRPQLPPNGALPEGGQGGMGGRGGGGGGGGMGGLLNGQTVSSEAEAALKKDASDYTWVAATIGSQNAASYQLATEKPVMAIGGFNGSDPSPTLDQFKQYVADGKIHYFLSSGEGEGGAPRGGGSGSGGGAEGAGGGGGGRGGGFGGSNSEISSWVESTFKKVTVDGATLYDLTQEV